MDIDVFGPNGGKPYNQNITKKIKAATIIWSVYMGLVEAIDSITIYLGRTINRGVDGDDDILGLCYAEKIRGKWCATICLSRRETDIEILEILAHEIVHINHFLRDGLDVNKRIYQGIQWPEVEHNELPWEKDAINHEITLMQHYLDYIQEHTVVTDD